MLFGTPRQGQATSPASSPIAASTTDQLGHGQSAREQQRFAQQQHQTAMSEMRLLGVDVTDRNNWTPRWERHPVASPPEDPRPATMYSGFRRAPNAPSISRTSSTTDGPAAISLELCTGPWNTNCGPAGPGPREGIMMLIHDMLTATMSPIADGEPAAYIVSPAIMRELIGKCPSTYIGICHEHRRFSIFGIPAYVSGAEREWRVTREACRYCGRPSELDRLCPKCGAPGELWEYRYD